MEGCQDEDIALPSASLISSLRVRSLTEALPETRLFRLLQKRQYDEAVEFAKQFDLDVQHVYKVNYTNIAT